MYYNGCFFCEEPFAGALGKKIPKSWSLYGIWRKYEIPFRSPPVTQGICLAMAGKRLEHQELTMATLLLLEFHCFLRTGEILQIRPCDFVLDSFNGVLSIPSSKSGVRSNSRESVTIHDPSAIETTLAMTTMKQQMGAMNVPCWQRSGSSFRALLKKF